MGRSFADVLQDHIVARTALPDCHTHAKTWDILRLTGMPAVRVEAGYLSNARDASLLSEPQVRQDLAESIAAAIHDFFAPG